MTAGADHVPIQPIAWPAMRKGVVVKATDPGTTTTEPLESTVDGYTVLELLSTGTRCATCPATS